MRPPLRRITRDNLLFIDSITVLILVGLVEYSVALTRNANSPILSECILFSKACERNSLLTREKIFSIGLRSGERGGIDISDASSDCNALRPSTIMYHHLIGVTSTKTTLIRNPLNTPNSDTRRQNCCYKSAYLTSISQNFQHRMNTSNEIPPTPLIQC